MRDFRFAFQHFSLFSGHFVVEFEIFVVIVFIVVVSRGFDYVYNVVNTAILF